MKIKSYPVKLLQKISGFRQLLFGIHLKILDLFLIYHLRLY